MSCLFLVISCLHAQIGDFHELLAFRSAGDFVIDDAEAAALAEALMLSLEGLYLMSCLIIIDLCCACIHFHSLASSASSTARASSMHD